MVEGYFTVSVSGDTIRGCFQRLTGEHALRTYGDPVIHGTSGQGRELNEGFDGFVPLVDSGIYIAVWVNPRFLSTIIYTCGALDADQAIRCVRESFGLTRLEAAVF